MGTERELDEDRCRRFEKHRQAGGTDALERFLPERTDPRYTGTLEELVAIELEIRWKAWQDDGREASSEPTLAEYVGRFPELADSGAADRLASEAAWLRQRADVGKAVAAGDRVGRYELVEPLGRGAFAAVWRARDAELSRDVAIKIPRPEIAGDATAMARVVREAQSAAGLRHPSIVPVHEVVQLGGRPCIVSELVEGPTLAALLRQRSFEPDEAARIVQKIARALAYAHGRGVVHRDVKPGNVLIDPGGLPVLADFGLAQLGAAGATLTRQGEILGTPAYMAPEQALGADDVDHRADVYALGAVLYEMLTGRQPFDAVSTAGVLYAVIHREPDRPSADGSVPADLETICLEAMNKERDRRYGTAEAFADDLGRYLDRRPIRARRPGALGRFRLWVRRRPVVAGTIFGSAVVVLLVGALALARVLEERGRFREQRDVAQANLYRSLVREAEAHIAAHDTGWLSSAREAIAEAARIETDDSNVRALRDLAIRCEASEHLSFELRTTWPAAESPLVAVAVSPDGERVAGIARDGSIVLRAAADGREIAAARPRGRPVALSFHAGGDVLAVAVEEGLVSLLDPATLTLRQEMLPSEGEELRDLAFAPAGDRVALAWAEGGVELRRWDGNTLLEERRLPAPPDEPVRVAFSNDGEMLACGALDGGARVWSCAQGVLRRTFDVQDPPRLLAFAPDDSRLVIATRENLSARIATLSDGRIQNALGGEHSKSAILFDARSRLVSAARDGSLNLVDGPRVVRAAGDFAPILAAALLGPRVLASHDDGALRVWEAEEPGGRHWRSHPAHTSTFVPGSARLVATANYVLDYGASPTPVPVAFDVAVARDAVRHGERVLFALADGKLAYADGPALDELRPWTSGGTGGGTGVTCVGAAGDVVVTGHEDGTVRVLRADGSLVTVHELDAGRVLAVHPSGEDGRLLVATAGGVADIAPDGVVWLARGARGHGAVALGERLVGVGMPDGRIVLHERDTLRQRGELKGHDVAVVALAFAGEELVSADASEVLFWDPDSPDSSAPLARLPANLPGEASGIAADPDGVFVAIESSAAIAILDRVGRAHVALAHGHRACWTAAGLVQYRSTGGAVHHPRQDILRERERVLPESGTGASVRFLEGRGVPWSRIENLMTWDVAASPDGRFIVTTGHRGDVDLWDAETTRFVRSLASTGEISWTAVFAPDSDFVAIASGAEVQVLDVATGDVRGTLPHGERIVVAVDWNRERPLIASASLAGDVRVWHAESLAPLGALAANGQAVHTLAFSPDGRRLAGARDDGQVLVWSTDGWEDGLPTVPPATALDGHRGAAAAVAWDPAGRYLASGSEKGIVLLRDAETLDVIARIPHPTSRIRSLAFDDTARYLAIECYVSTNATWDLHTLRARLADLGLDW